MRWQYLGYLGKLSEHPACLERLHSFEGISRVFKVDKAVPFGRGRGRGGREEGEGEEGQEEEEKRKERKMRKGPKHSVGYTHIISSPTASHPQTK